MPSFVIVATDESTKGRFETSDEVFARIVPQDLLNYLPPLQRLLSERTSDFYLPESSGRLFAGICRVLKEQDIPTRSPTLFTAGEKTFCDGKGATGNNARREEHNPVTAARAMYSVRYTTQGMRGMTCLQEEVRGIFFHACACISYAFFRVNSPENK